MNKFICPVHDYNSGIYNISVNAVSFEEAREKIMQHYRDIFDDLEAEDWDDFLVEIDSVHDLYIGEPNDIETL